MGKSAGVSHILNSIPTVGTGVGYFCFPRRSLAGEPEVARLLAFGKDGEEGSKAGSKRFTPATADGETSFFPLPIRASSAEWAMVDKASGQRVIEEQAARVSKRGLNLEDHGGRKRSRDRLAKIMEMSRDVKQTVGKEVSKEIVNVE